MLDANGGPVDEGVAASEPDAVDSWLRSRGGGWTVRRVIFETGQLSTHFHQALRESWPVTCIDARHANATLKAQRNKTDKNDARGLAQIARTGWYKAVHVKSDSGQALRALIGGRKQLVSLRQEIENHIRGTLKTFGVKLGEVAAGGFADKVRAGVEGKDGLVRAVICAMLKARDGILAQIDTLDKKCRALARKDEVCKRLMTIPGVGVVTSLSFMAEIDDPTRFRRSRDVGAHLGLTPRTYASGETERSSGISRCGSGSMRTLLFEASVTMLTRSGKWSRLKAWGLELRERTGFKNASTAMARKLAVIMHRMWLDGTEFKYGREAVVKTAATLPPGIYWDGSERLARSMAGDDHRRTEAVTGEIGSRGELREMLRTAIPHGSANDGDLRGPDLAEQTGSPIIGLSRQG